ncbi:hypothetical protein BH20VER3_BH20VER3_17320 [soil metagenome]
MAVFLSYVLSFVFLGIYWNNHHHMLHAVRRVTGRSLWSNLHLLFWLSLVPFVTGWMGENHFAAAPVALYGVVLLGAACAYWLLQRSFIRTYPKPGVACVAVRLGRWPRREDGAYPRGSATNEQRRPAPKSAPPSGRKQAAPVLG